jgi:Cd2+/Zn2+-exporting ATPase
MGAEGTDAAIETADVALMQDDLRQLPVAVSLGRRAVRIIRTNIFFSLVTKATFVLLAMLGQATLWMAVAADMGTSLLVTLNGMRLLRGDPGTPNAPLWVSELPAAGPKTGSSCDCCDNK